MKAPCRSVKVPYFSDSDSTRRSNSVPRSRTAKHFPRNRRVFCFQRFKQERQRIRMMCAEALDQNSVEGVVLHSGLFSVKGMEPERGAMA
ncbi:hypothetical protein SAMN06265784_10829 [Paraburkholderia susongensis]|uniref:Uncharacterized protein n=1 Tax=Paraburkholderia susongensis TaxID=1515439 RepID=A0A1X7LQI7_9BURK|nr:hypothetical protein SAMN06265784_10829 [Paraburkholderia susongensis]